MLVLGIVSVFFVATVDERSGGDTFYVCRHLGRGVVTLPEVCYTMSSRNFPNRKRPFSIIRQPEHDGQQIIRVDDFHPSGRPFSFPYATKKEGKKHTHTKKKRSGKQQNEKYDRISCQTNLTFSASSSSATSGMYPSHKLHACSTPSAPPIPDPGLDNISLCASRRFPRALTALSVANSRPFSRASVRDGDTIRGASC